MCCAGVGPLWARDVNLTLAVTGESQASIPTAKTLSVCTLSRPRPLSSHPILICLSFTSPHHPSLHLYWQRPSHSQGSGTKPLELGVIKVWRWLLSLSLGVNLPVSRRRFEGWLLPPPVMLTPRLWLRSHSHSHTQTYICMHTPQRKWRL